MPDAWPNGRWRVFSGGMDSQLSSSEGGNRSNAKDMSSCAVVGRWTDTGVSARVGPGPGLILHERHDGNASGRPDERCGLLHGREQV